jgi:hypothetical protein
LAGLERRGRHTLGVAERAKELASLLPPSELDAGRLTHRGRSWTLHLPARWPWQDDYLDTLKRIRALPAA